MRDAPELSAAWHAARRAGLPLLVIVVPQRGGSERGRAVGEALEVAPASLLAALGGYAPVCATAAALRQLGAEVPAGAWFAVVGTDEGVPRLLRSAEGAPRTARAVKQLLWDAAGGSPPQDDPAPGRARWLEGRIPGSYWARHSGCGVEIEGYDSPFTFDCGMGHIPDRAERFLLFLDGEPR